MKISPPSTRRVVAYMALGLTGVLLIHIIGSGAVLATAGVGTAVTLGILSSVA